MAEVERVVDKFIGELQEQLVEKHITLDLTDAGPPLARPAWL